MVAPGGPLSVTVTAEVYVPAAGEAVGATRIPKLKL
jgi:hypothetical protein